MMPCFKCGHPGHFAHECMHFIGNPSTNFDSFIDMHQNKDMLINHSTFVYNNNNISNNGSQRCYRCNEFGHIARECTSNNDIRTCYNCGQNGHIRTECIAPLNMNNNLQTNTQCYRCGQLGHFARDCIISIENTGIPVSHISNNVFNDRICFNCSRTGHIATACPEGHRTDMRDMVCYCCNRPGHLSRDCPDSNIKCYSCGSTGHMARDCLNNRIFSSSSSSFQARQTMIPQ
ncbi:unnamed protein product [Adineta steineri]|uniref:CCHC-type domain-containing protein n=1 Tax=Adineta steineri TaxID=433720 RepID=A0A813T457_9BILA|nr:unnamed protein product [Adineta steineri]